MSKTFFQNLQQKPFFKFFIFPLSLSFVSFAMIFSYILTSDLSFTILSNYYGKNILTNFINPLKKGDVVKGEFKARENNLGIVAVAFDPRYKTWDDIIFRIKEKGQSTWYFSNKYWAGQLIDFQHFSFGFPNIKVSKNKTYQFEISSLVAKQGEGEGINKKFPSVIVKYQFQKNDLLSNKLNLFKFLIKKFVSNLSTPEFIFIFLVSLTPFLIYLFYLINNLFALRMLTIVPLILLFGDIFIIRKIYTSVFIILLFLLFFNFKNSKLLYLLCFLLLLMPVIVIMNFSYMQYKVNLWFVLILIVTVLQKIVVELLFTKRRVVIT